MGGGEGKGEWGATTQLGKQAKQQTLEEQQSTQQQPCTFFFCFFFILRVAVEGPVRPLNQREVKRSEIEVQPAALDEKSF